MKNITKSLPALALTGALTFVVAPAADAQSTQGGSSQQGSSGSYSESAQSNQSAESEVARETSSGSLSGNAGAEGKEDLPVLNEWIAGGVAGTYNGAEWFYHQDTKHVVADKDDFEQDLALIPADKQMTIEAFADVAGYRVRTEGDDAAAAGEGKSGSSLIDNADQIAGLSSGSMLPLAIVGEIAGNLDGQKWFYNKDINFVVNNPELVNTDVKPGQPGVKLTVDFANELKKALPINVITQEISSDLGSSANGSLTNGSSNGINPGSVTEGSSGNADLSGNTGGLSGNGGSSASDAARLALIALPAVLIIGGITWYLNQDGRTYVQNSSRVDAAPSEQEKMSSEQMLSSNRGEVQRQSLGSSEGSSVDATKTNGQVEGQNNGGDKTRNEAASEQVERGMAAQTGSNGFAKGLVALLIASVLGTAAFFYGRKQLV